MAWRERERTRNMSFIYFSFPIYMYMSVRFSTNRWICLDYGYFLPLLRLLLLLRFSVLGFILKAGAYVIFLFLLFCVVVILQSWCCDVLLDWIYICIVQSRASIRYSIVQFSPSTFFVIIYSFSFFVFSLLNS